MRKNKTMGIAAALLVATLLTTSMISGTFAKYTSSGTGTDSARVAKWEVTYENNASGSSEVSLTGAPQDLSITLFDYTDSNVDTNGADDNGKVIAPGTTGNFSFTVTSKSEVAAQTDITLTETNKKSIPIEYGLATSEGAPATWVKADDDGKINLSMTKQFTAQAAKSNETQQYTVYWRWAFTGANSANYGESQTDTKDTTLGMSGTDTVSVNLSITATQVD